MSHRYQFESPTPEQARDFLASRRKAIRGDRNFAAFVMAESYPDAIACDRALMPVTTPEERRIAREFAVPQKAYPCGRCGRFAFPDDRTLCFWCRS